MIRLNYFLNGLWSLLRVVVNTTADKCTCGLEDDAQPKPVTIW